MIVLQEIVVDGLRHMEAAEVVAGGGRLLADDAAGVGRVVAADIEEIADVVGAGAVEDLLAIGLVGLVAGRAERRRRRAREALEPVCRDGVRSTSPSSPALTSPRTPCRMPRTRFTWPVAQRLVFKPSMTPTSDWLITAVGPPDWPIAAFPETRSATKPLLLLVRGTMPNTFPAGKVPHGDLELKGL